jgi:hypothetical protein
MAVLARFAARLLDKLIAQMPFKVSGIQVDGGSEFMADFEEPANNASLPSDAFAHRFNHYRPHDALDGKTGRVSLIPQPSDLAVSYVLNPDSTY